MLANYSKNVHNLVGILLINTGIQVKRVSKVTLLGKKSEHFPQIFLECTNYMTHPVPLPHFRDGCQHANTTRTINSVHINVPEFGEGEPEATSTHLTCVSHHLAEPVLQHKVQVIISLYLYLPI